MLVGHHENYRKVAFTDEAEIERVVQTYAEQLFGSSIVYLSQARVSTIGGRGTVPDAIVIDVEANEWYVVEAERAIHGTWEHVAPQVSRQLAAVAAPHTAELIIRLALDQLRASAPLREMFRDVGVSEIEAHGRLQTILRKPPTIAIPIDAIPKDLAEWARTLRNSVKIWVIDKFVSESDPTHVLYSVPDENFPTISTSSDVDGTLKEVRATGSQPFQDLIAGMPELIGQPVSLEYGPRGGQRQTFNGTIRADGIEFEGIIYSASYAALKCVQKAGSSRKTANGWVMWRIGTGEFLNDLYQKLRLRDDTPGGTES